MFVSGVKPSFAASCNSTTGRFCETYTAVCGDWAGATSCEEWYLAAPAGEAGATEGASQGCYSYHLGVAAMSAENATTHCPHARGEAVCVAATAPTAAEAFCAQFETTCGAWMGATPCVEWFNAAPAMGTTEGAGANQACYSYHLGVAAANNGAEAATHCPHAAGGAPCVN